MITLAEAIFVYSDELGSDVVEGYLRMQSDEAGERERRRRRLATLLLDADGHDPDAIERAAELARWPVPRTFAALALASETPGAITRRLGVDALPAADRERLLQTLAAWLAHQRHTPAIAAELHVHPQTVRYRMGKLRELLGEELDTAEGRFELELALRARHALAG